MAGLGTNGHAYITDCLISNNTAANSGVGFYANSEGNYYDISGSTFKGNQVTSAQGKGGAIYTTGLMATTSHIKYTILEANDAFEGGGVYLHGYAFTEIDHCTIVNNTGATGGGIYYDSTGLVDIMNSIFASNTPSAIHNEGNPWFMGFSDFYGNGVNMTGIVPGWFGYLNLTNANGDPCDHYYSIFLDPLFVNYTGGDYHLTVNSPCIDAGTPYSQYDPDSTITDIGRYFFDQSITPPPVSVTLTPINPPIVIPASGGSFQFDASVANNTTSPTTFQAWIKVQLPNGSWYGPVLGPFSLTLPANQSVTRQRTQAVPMSAPAGLYTYRGWVGTYPSSPGDSSSFTFTKSATGNVNPGFSDWTCSGEPFPGEELASSEIYPSSFILYPSSPNPLNPSTVASFELRVPSYVRLTVWDTAGRLVATLADGWRQAGEHQVAFDGAGLASGIYLVKLRAGEFSSVQKLILLK